jgi:hypothetical protein
MNRRREAAEGMVGLLIPRLSHFRARNDLTHWPPRHLASRPVDHALAGARVGAVQPSLGVNAHNRTMKGVARRPVAMRCHEVRL